VRFTCDKIRFTVSLCVFFSSFHFFRVFFFFNSCFLLYTKILVVLVFIMAIHWFIAQVVSLQPIAIVEDWSMMSALLFFSEFVDVPPKVQNIWKEQLDTWKVKILKSFWIDVSTMCTRLSYNIFQALIRVVGPSLEWKKYKHEIKYLCLN